MKMRVGFLILVLSAASQANAQTAVLNESPYVAVTLTAPSSPWVNLADCQNASNVLLSISWSISSTANTTTTFYGWPDQVNADVFFSIDSSCDAVLFDIRDPANGTFGSTASTFTASDIAIPAYSSSQSSGVFPDSTQTSNTNASTPLTLQELITKNQSLLGSGSCPTYQADLYFCIRWQDSATENLTTYLLDYSGGALIRYDTQPPGAPVLNAVNPGDSNLKLQWTAPSDDDLAGYNIYYRVSSTDPNATWSIKNTTDAGATSYQLTGSDIHNDVTYDVKVSAIDKTENEGDASLTLTGTPIPIYDFFDTYKNDKGKDKGGCFVATAAYGSYEDSMVMPLRRFRDETLSKSSFGRNLIASYYQYGPRWARAIRDSAFYRTVARGVLMPVVAVAEASNYLGPSELLLLLGFAALVLCGFMLVRRWRGQKLGPAAGALFLFFAMAAFSSKAQADDSSKFQDVDSRKAQASEPRFQFIFRCGPYYPDVDSEKGLTGHPFKDIFGRSKRWLFELGGDYEIWHEAAGTFTIGGSFGFVQYRGKGLTESGEPSSDTAILNLLPLRLTVGHHFDVFARRWNIPLVPYIGAGLSYYIWWSTNGVGSTTGKGGIFGFHALGGLKFLLDFLDEEAAMSLENEIGIKHTYLFVEYEASFIPFQNIDQNKFGSGNRMNLSDKTIMFGMMMEF